MWRSNLAARAISLLLRSERVRARLIGRAMHRPFTHLDGYMNRYWLFNEKWKWRWLPAIRIHAILRRDGDRDIHDHPFDFRTFILFGGYVEQDIMGREKICYEGSTYYSRAERFHIITHADPSDRFVPAAPKAVWTLVIMSPKRQDWGFLTLVGGLIRKVHHKQYKSMNQYVQADLTEESLLSAVEKIAALARLTGRRVSVRPTHVVRGSIGFEENEGG